jgi:hypothetical protein
MATKPRTFLARAVRARPIISRLVFECEGRGSQHHPADRRIPRRPRSSQIVFLTDGLPTIGTTDPKKILEIVSRKESQGTRIYTFGVGDDVDAGLLDAMAETTRGSSTYVRPNENLESKVSARPDSTQWRVGRGQGRAHPAGSRILDRHSFHQSAGFGAGGTGSAGRASNQDNRRPSLPAAQRPTLGDGNSGIQTAPTGVTAGRAAGQPTTGKAAIDLAQGLADLKMGARADTSANQRTVAGRQFRKVGNAWVDQSFTSSTPTLRLRVLGKAYFQLLDSHPELKSIFVLGTRIT